MSWSRKFEIEHKGQVKGKVICTSKDDYSEFFAEIIIADTNYQKTTSQNNSPKEAFIIPTLKIKTSSYTELYEQVDIVLKDIFGSGVERNPML